MDNILKQKTKKKNLREKKNYKVEYTISNELIIIFVIFILFNNSTCLGKILSNFFVEKYLVMFAHFIY